MNNPSPATEVRWGNDDKGALYIAPLSCAAFLFFVAMMAWGFQLTLTEDFGEKWLKQYALLALFPLLGLFSAWFARLTLLMIWEFLTKFIVHTGSIEGDEVKLKGFYFRRAHFRLDDIAAIEPLEFDKFRWSNLTEDATNYIVTVQDGRKFYLSGWLDDADGFAAALGYRNAATA